MLAVAYALAVLLCAAAVSGLYYDSCARPGDVCSLIADETKIRCRDDDVSRSSCEAAGCCYQSNQNNQQLPSCFYPNLSPCAVSGKATSDPGLIVYNDWSVTVDGAAPQVTNENFQNIAYSVENWYELPADKFVQLDFGKNIEVYGVYVYTYGWLNNGMNVYVSAQSDPYKYANNEMPCGETEGNRESDGMWVACSPSPMRGRYVTIESYRGRPFYIKEIVVIGEPPAEDVLWFGDEIGEGGERTHVHYQREAVVIPDYTQQFTGTHGRVVGWRVRLARSHPVRLGFWRPLERTTYRYKEYLFVGGTEVSSSNPPEVLEVTLPEDQQFDIQAGDVLGVGWSDGEAIAHQPPRSCLSRRPNLVLRNDWEQVKQIQFRRPGVFVENSMCTTFYVQAKVNVQTT